MQQEGLQAAGGRGHEKEEEREKERAREGEKGRGRERERERERERANAAQQPRAFFPSFLATAGRANYGVHFTYTNKREALNLSNIGTVNTPYYRFANLNI